MAYLPQPPQQGLGGPAAAAVPDPGTLSMKELQGIAQNMMEQGLSREQVDAYFQGQGVPLPALSLGEEFGRQFERAGTELMANYAESLGMPNRAQQLREAVAQNPQLMPLVSEVQDIEGAMDSLYWLTGLAAGSAPEMGAQALGAAGGFMTGGPAGALLGASVASVPQHYQRNKQAQIEAGVPEEEVDRGKAVAAAAIQTALDTGGFARVLRPLGITGARAERLNRNTRRLLREGKGARAVAGKVGKEALKGAAFEGGTEGLQDLVTVAQSDPNLEAGFAKAVGPENWSNLLNSVAGGAVLGGPIAGTAAAAGAPKTYMDRVKRARALTAAREQTAARETAATQAREAVDQAFKASQAAYRERGGTSPFGDVVQARVAAQIEDEASRDQARDTALLRVAGIPTEVIDSLDNAGRTQAAKHLRDTQGDKLTHVPAELLAYPRQGAGRATIPVMQGPNPLSGKPVREVRGEPAQPLLAGLRRVGLNPDDYRVYQPIDPDTRQPTGKAQVLPAKDATLENRPYPFDVDPEPAKSEQEVDQAAQRAEPAPTDQQRRTDDYRKGEVNVGGVPIEVETPKGQVRRSKPGAQTPWEVEMPVHYGRIPGTTSADGGAVDAFVGPNPQAATAYVIDQRKPGTSELDESKALVGFDSPEDALAAYHRSFAGDFADRVTGPVTPVPMSELVNRLKQHDPAKPFSGAEGLLPRRDPGDPTQSPEPTGPTTPLIPRPTNLAWLQNDPDAPEGRDIHGQYPADGAETTSEAQAIEFLLEDWQPRTGNEAMVAIGPSGENLGVVTSDANDHVALPVQIGRLLRNPEHRIQLVHNHPNDAGLSVADIKMLYHKGLGEIVAVTQTMQRYAARPVEAWQKVPAHKFDAAVDAVNGQVRRRLQQMVNSDQMGVEMAQEVHPHLRAQVLHDLGIIQNDTSWPGSEIENGIAREIVRDVRQTYGPLFTVGGTAGGATTGEGAARSGLGAGPDVERDRRRYPRGAEEPQRLTAEAPIAELLTPEERQISSVPYLYRGEPFPGVTGKKKVSNREAAQRFMDNYREAYGPPPESPADITPEILERTAKLIAAEAEAAVDNRLEQGLPDARGWYDDKVTKALQLAGTIHPELVDPEAGKASVFGSTENAMTALTMPMAITSQNVDVKPNMGFAIEVYEELKKNLEAGGEPEYPLFETGSKGKSMAINFQIANKLLAITPGSVSDKFEAAREFLNSELLLADLKKDPDFGKYAPADMLVDQEVYGSAVFGPKIGYGFWQNLNGNFDPITIDLWMTRTWNRLTGRSMGNIVAYPKQVDALRQAMEEAHAYQAAITDPQKHAAKVRRQKAKLVKLTAQRDALEEKTGPGVTARKKQITALNKQIKALDREIGAGKGWAPPPMPDFTDKDAVLEFADEIDRQWNRHYKQATEAQMVAQGFPAKKPKDETSEQKEARLAASKAVSRAVTASDRAPWIQAARQIKASQMKPVDVPRNGTERRQIEQAMRRALELLEEAGTPLTPADLQAVIWYPEKDIWEVVKNRSPEDLAKTLNVDYATAMGEIAAKRGVPAADIEAILEAETGGYDGRRAGPGPEPGRSGRSTGAAGQRGRGRPRAGDQPGAGPDVTGAARGGAQAADGDVTAADRAPANRARARLDEGVPESYVKADSRSGIPALGGLTPVASYSPNAATKRALAKVGGDAPTYHELPRGPEGARVFHDAISAGKDSIGDVGAAVYVYPLDEYAGMRTFLTDDGLTGFALKGDDIVSVFKARGGAKRAVDSLLPLAVQLGGRQLDAFDTILPELYAPHGFEVASRLSWVDEYAPDGWNKAAFEDYNRGEPDVVFMAYTGDRSPYVRGQGDYAPGNDYDEAVAAQQALKTPRLVAETDTPTVEAARDLPRFIKPLERHPTVQYPSYIAPPPIKQNPLVEGIKLIRDPNRPMSTWLQVFEDRFVNGFAPLRRLEFRATQAEDLLPGMDSAVKSAEIAMNEAGRNETLLMYGALDYQPGTGVRVAKGTIGLVPMLRKLGGPDQIRKWQEFMASRRAQALRNRARAAARALEELGEVDVQGDPELTATRRALREKLKADVAKGRTPLSDQDIERGLSYADEPRFQEVADDWQRFNRANVEFARKMGVISPGAAAALNADAAYVPFYRVQPGDTGIDADYELLGPAELAKVGLSHPDTGIRGLKGGEKLKLADLVTNMIRNSKAMTRAAMRNQANLRALDMMEMAGEVSYPPEGQRDGAIKVYRDGKEVWYRPHDPAVALALQGLTPVQRDGLWKAMRSFANIFRRGITLSPGFMVRNWIRGMVSTGVLTGQNLSSAHNTFNRLYSAWRNDERRQEFVAASGMGDWGVGGAAAGDVLIDLGLEPKTIASRIRKTVDKMEHVGAGFEFADRIALMQNLMADGVPRDEAAYQALNVLNYARHGNSPIIGGLMPLVPFMNARIQGLARLVEDVYTKKGAARQKALMGLLMRGAPLAGLSWALWAWNNLGDEERRQQYEAEPLHRRLNYHIVYAGDKKLLLPKAFEIGVIFGTVPEMLLGELPQGDTDEITKAAMMTVVNTLGMNPAPQAILPMLEVTTNYDFFRGRPIEGQRVQGLQPQDRVNPSTSFTARAIGELTGASPLNVDHLIAGYGGAWGAMLMGGIDAIAGGMGLLPPQPEGAFGSIPGVSRAAEVTLGTMFKNRDADTANRYVEDFYQFKGDLAQIHNSLRDARMKGDVERMQELVAANPGYLAAHRMASAAGRQLSKINAAMRRIRESNLGPAAKRQQLIPLIRARNELSQRMTKAFYQLAEQGLVNAA